MNYLLDTAIIVALLRGRPGAVARITPWIANNEAVTCVVCYAEIIERFQGLPNYVQNLAATRLFLRQVKPLPLTYPALEQYATIRRTLRPLGQLIGDIDTLIASEALQRHLTVVTVDHDFERVPGLSVMVFTRDELFNAP